MQPSLPLHGEAPTLPASRSGFALARKGFRPFFLLAAAYACAIVPLWVLVFTGVLPPAAYLDPASWHAHEMVFGFSVAVIAGFLLTAVGNWTQRETVVGAPLLGLSALWVAGRVVMVAPGLFPRGLPAVVDLAFLPVLAVVLARPLVASRNYRNLVMIAVLGALVGANSIVHLGALGVLGAGAPRHACLVGIDVVVLVILIMAGRVFPMFTRNATGATNLRSSPVLDGLTVVGMAVLTILDAIDHDGPVAAAGAGVVSVLAIARAARWVTWRAARIPLVWVLHAGYAWACVGLLLRALAGFVPAVPGSLAMHALTVGAIGTLTLGMMARVALGHTGRPLVAPRAMAWSFGMITAAAFARAVLPLLAPAAYVHALVAAALLWTAAFLVYLVSYGPVLWASRLDGKPG